MLAMEKSSNLPSQIFDFQNFVTHFFEWSFTFFQNLKKTEKLQKLQNFLKSVAELLALPEYMDLSWYLQMEPFSKLFEMDVLKFYVSHFLWV